MTKLLSFACGAVLFAAFAAPVFGYDDDVPYAHERDISVRTVTRTSTYGVVAYYPTLRYYAKNGVIAYGFKGLTRSDLRRVTEADPLMVPPGRLVAGGVAPRMIVTAQRPFFRATKKITTITTETETPAPAAPVTPPAESTPAPAPAPDATPAPAPAEGAK